MVSSRNEHTPLLKDEVIAPSSPHRAVRWAAAAAIGSLALFAAVSVGQVAPMSLAAFNPSRLGQEDTLANAEAQRRTAAANEAEATRPLGTPATRRRWRTRCKPKRKPRLSD